MRAQHRPIQGPRSFTYSQAEGLQDAVKKTCGVNCLIFLGHDKATIKAESLADYFLAKTVVKNRLGLPIERSAE